MIGRARYLASLVALLQALSACAGATPSVSVGAYLVDDSGPAEGSLAASLEAPDPPEATAAPDVTQSIDVSTPSSADTLAPGPTRTPFPTCPPTPVGAATPTWTVTGAMRDARHSHTATLLASGKVLVAGGSGSSGVLSSAELYDPATGAWTVTGTMTIGRVHHTATLLPSGAVLVSGGSLPTRLGFLGTAELYDPLTGTWTNTTSMATARSGHTETLLGDGRVLVTGGIGTGENLATTEVFDPATGTWTNGRPLVKGRHLHSAALLPNGRVFIRDGLQGEFELYDPAAETGRFGSLGLFPGLLSTATYVPLDGTVVLPSESRYHVARDEFLAPNKMNLPYRQEYRATLFVDPQIQYPTPGILVTGGINFHMPGALASAEVLENIDWWTTVPDMTTPRRGHSATSLPDGRVLVAGGTDGCLMLASAEIFNPGRR